MKTGKANEKSPQPDAPLRSKLTKIKRDTGWDRNNVVCGASD
ncbi:hypothetical protein CKA32_002064 [Geitlerinema sp. FC II]|nr:hypothetical protein CKA32_002064 [Geitlerinema sp. FC II]